MLIRYILILNTANMWAGSEVWTEPLCCTMSSLFITLLTFYESTKNVLDLWTDKYYVSFCSHKAQTAWGYRFSHQINAGHLSSPYCEWGIWQFNVLLTSYTDDRGGTSVSLTFTEAVMIQLMACKEQFAKYHCLLSQHSSQYLVCFGDERELHLRSR